MTEDVLLALEPVAAVFDELSVEYRIGGSIASSALGVPRSTIDVDLVADLRLEHVDALVRTLEATYYIDGHMIRDAIVHRDSFNLIHLATMMKVDVFVLKRRPFEESAFGRVVFERLGAEPDARVFPLTTAEDIVVHKLVWFRLGGGASNRQWEDLLGVLKLRGSTLDMEYVTRWAVDQGVADLLERAKADAGLRTT